MYTVFEYTKDAETMKKGNSFSVANVKLKDSFYEMRFNFRTYGKNCLYKLHRESTVFMCDTIERMNRYINRLPDTALENQ